jgi:hypothetical protein
MEVHNCNPTYSRGGDGRMELQSQPGQKVRDPVSVNKPSGTSVHTCNPSYAGRRMTIQGWLGQKVLDTI